MSDDVYEKGMADLLAGYREHFDMERWRLHKHIQSPIELRFADAMLCTHISYVASPWCVDPGTDWQPGNGLQISPQYRIGPYRADFALRFKEFGLSSQLIVECDGHAFHEKTKEQAQKDKERDRYLLAKGWPVMRFTGSELHRDPHACAEQVADHLWEEWSRINQLFEGASRDPS